MRATRRPNRARPIMSWKAAMIHPFADRSVTRTVRRKRVKKERVELIDEHRDVFVVQRSRVDAEGPCAVERQLDDGAFAVLGELERQGRSCALKYTNEVLGLAEHAREVGTVARHPHDVSLPRARLQIARKSAQQL